MKVCVFLGPTLSHEAARRVWDVPDYLPPVRQGDLYAAARRRPRAIAIVDGYFRGVPAVWHKEILWAMSRGIHVFGASSMGALRAAELDAFGMVGVGEVYESLARGEWEDDDEVAVVHAPEAFGYTPLSDAMVDIRATLARAREASVVDAATERALLALAKARSYTERGYERLLADAESDPAIDAARLEALRRWLPEGRVRRKALDAEALLVHLRERAETLRAPLRVDYAFEHTEAWTLAAARRRAPPPTSTSALALEAVKLDGTWRRLARTALLRQVLSFGRGWRPTVEHLARARDILRRTHGLWRADALARWQESNGLDEQGFADLVDSEARVLRAATEMPSLDEHIVRELRARDDYAWRLEEAERLRAALAAADERPADAASPTLHELMDAAGIDGDAGELARRSGFDDVDALYRALLHRHRAGRPVRTIASSDDGTAR